MAEIAGLILQFANMIWSPSCECLKYHRGFDDNMDILKRRLEELNCRKEDIESRKKAELVQGKTLKKEVRLWLQNVGKINSEFQNIQVEVGRRKYCAWAHLGKLVFKMIKEVEELHRNGSFLDSLVVDESPHDDDEILALPTSLLSGETAKRKMEEIWESLNKNDVTKFGVYGMGGAGKTTLMKNIHNRLKERKKFDEVIWVTVSKALTLTNLQNDIITALHRDREFEKYKSEATRAAKLFEEFRKRKKWVLILDDLWEVFQLVDVGIPEPTQENGCKLLITTRSLDVCRGMGCIYSKVELLSKEEAWELFLNRVGLGDLLTPELEAIVRQVADECACLPLAIVTIAGSMLGVTDTCEWWNALEELREATRGLNEMGKVIEQLKFSYTRLKDDSLRNCLLFCSLYPEDYKIERKKLVKYLIADGVIEGTKNMQAQYNKGHSMLNKLENASLLESAGNSKGDACVKMHDLIRDMAINITRKSPRFLIQAGVRLREIPDDDKWTEYLDKVSLMNNLISEIPSGHSPKCPKLSMLLLQGNSQLVSIADSFFTYLSKLSILDLSQTNIEYLPNSISNLKNLTVLYLTSCRRLIYVPSLAKLGALKELDLSDSTIKNVPEGTEMLASLIRLCLSGTDIEMMPDGILPNLFHLKCLMLMGRFKSFKVKGEEISGLRRLETFEGEMYGQHDLNVCIGTMHGRGLKNYFLKAKQERYFMEFGEGCVLGKKVEVKGCRITTLLLPNDVEYLCIDSCHDVSSLSDLLFSAASSHYPDITPVPTSHFSCLKNLNIESCPCIKKLFTPGMLFQLQNLEEMIVYDCQELKELEAEEEEVNKDRGEASTSSINSPTIEHDANIVFILPKLRSLSLSKLPALNNICRGTLVCESLQLLTISNCPKLKRLPLSLPLLNGQPSPPSDLVAIHVGEKLWKSLKWDNPCRESLLRPFCKFMNWE